MGRIRIAESDGEIETCFPPILSRRPRLKKDEFLARVRRLYDKENYRLAYYEHDKRVRAVGGFRVLETLSQGKHLIVDDLSILEEDRQKNYLGEILDWLADYGRSRQCRHIVMDTGVQDFNRQRFLRNKGLSVTKFRLSLPL